MLVRFVSEWRDNYVDEYNRFAGFDNGQCCCEFSRAFIVGLNGEEIKPDRADRFTQIWDELTFADEAPVEDDGAALAKLLGDDKYHCTDFGGVVRFKLMEGPCSPAGWLVFINSHNGYYTHSGEYHMGKGTEFCL